MSIAKLLSQVTRQKLVLPFYHAIADNAPIHLKHLYKVRPINQFERDLDFLLKNYEPIDIHGIFEHVNGSKCIDKPSFFISFDDGLREFKEYALPLLIKKGVPAALFVNTDFVDNKKLFYRFKVSILLDFISENKNEKLIKEANEVFKSMISTMENITEFIKGTKYNQDSFLDSLAELFQINFNKFLDEYKPYLSKSELQELASNGIHIGAHSKDHPMFMDISDNEKAEQLFGSVNWVQDNIKQGLNSFSYPFTDYGVFSSFFNKVFESEAPKVDLTFGTAGIKKERFKRHLQRIPVEDYSSEMQSILKQQYLYYLAKAPLFKNKVRR